MGFFAKLFGNRDKKIQDYLDRQAIIIDVRTPNEYSSMAIPGSTNVPVQNIGTKISDLKSKNKPVLVYCASGMRSASAAAVLKGAGIEVFNAGSINRLMKFF